jgi:hypothetical protein
MNIATLLMMIFFCQLSDDQVADFLFRCSTAQKPETNKEIEELLLHVKEKQTAIENIKAPKLVQPKPSKAKNPNVRQKEDRIAMRKAEKEYEIAKELFEKSNLKQDLESQIHELREKISIEKAKLELLPNLITPPKLSTSIAKEGTVGFLVINGGGLNPNWQGLEFIRKWNNLPSAGEFYTSRLLTRAVIHGVDARVLINKTVYQAPMPLIAMTPTADQNIAQFRLATAEEVEQLQNAVRDKFGAEMIFSKSPLDLPVNKY